MILESNYIQKYHDLSIQSTPHFINERTVNQLLKKIISITNNHLTQK